MGNNIRNIIAAVACIVLSAACSEAEIPLYQVEDSAVFFSSVSTDFSLKGNLEAEPELRIKINMFGPKCDYDRHIQVAVADSTYNDAVEGVDFSIVSAVVPAESLSGEIVLKVKALTEEVQSHTVALVIEPNEDFPRMVKDRNMTKLRWSKEFVRPSNTYAWQAWYYFFSHGYSAAYHELLYNFFGADIEITGYTNGALHDPDSKYKVISWWYTANREFYSMVAEHDKANPDSPYMHSSDFELYDNYLVAVGNGSKPDVIPTLLSTLLVY